MRSLDIKKLNERAAQQQLPDYAMERLRLCGLDDKLIFYIPEIDERDMRRFCRTFTAFAANDEETLKIVELYITKLFFEGLPKDVFNDVRMLYPYTSVLTGFMFDNANYRYTTVIYKPEEGSQYFNRKCKYCELDMVFRLETDEGREVVTPFAGSMKSAKLLYSGAELKKMKWSDAGYNPGNNKLQRKAEMLGRIYEGYDTTILIVTPRDRLAENLSMKYFPIETAAKSAALNLLVHNITEEGIRQWAYNIRNATTTSR